MHRLLAMSCHVMSCLFAIAMGHGLPWVAMCAMSFHVAMGCHGLLCVP